MDIITVLGIIGALTAILLGYHIEGGHLESLLNPSAFFIVCGGTLGAALVETPFYVLRRSFIISGWVIFPPSMPYLKIIEKIVAWGNIVRREGLLGLDSVADSEDDEFTKKGLQLLVDGRETKGIRGVLETEINAIEDRDLLSAKFFECMGGYSPTIGIIGAVMGLIHVLGNLNDPAALGPGIAVAFVATIYGVSMANLLFLPMSQKLQKHIRAQSRLKELILEGLIGIADGEHPKMLEIKLKGYYP